MSEPGDPMRPEPPIVSVPAASGAAPDPSAVDDRTARRTALRDLAALIGVEVFY